MRAPTTVIRLRDADGIVRSGATHPPARCTCPLVWHAIVPPPRCPVHGQSQMQIIC